MSARLLRGAFMAKYGDADATDTDVLPSNGASMPPQDAPTGAALPRGAIARLAISAAHDLREVLTIVDRYTAFQGPGPFDEQQRVDLETAHAVVRRGVELVEQLVARGREPQSRGASRGGEGVLVVEADPVIRAAMRRTLKLEGFAVQEAADGMEAAKLGVSYQGALDLMVCNWLMPCLGASETIRRVRAARPGLRVLFVSGKGQPPADHELGNGSELLVRPFTPERLVLAVRETLQKPPNVSQNLPTRPVVLIVDDELDVRESLARLMEECQLQTYSAPSGLHAVAILQKHHVDVVVSDQSMPGMDGIRLLTLVRERWGHCQRILYTALPSSDVVLDAVNRGGVHKVLLKTMHPVQLRDDIERAALEAARFRLHG
ncbi:MAG TPA: response regulator [Polyangiaceae bacterium]|nr:response regulator [Polyangiaceae bacterium]